MHHIPNTVNKNNDFDLQTMKKKSTLLDARVELHDYEKTSKHLPFWKGRETNNSLRVNKHKIKIKIPANLL